MTSPTTSELQTKEKSDCIVEEPCIWDLEGVDEVGEAQCGIGFNKDYYAEITHETNGLSKGDYFFSVYLYDLRVEDNTNPSYIVERLAVDTIDEVNDLINDLIQHYS